MIGGRRLTFVVCAGVLSVVAGPSSPAAVSGSVSGISVPSSTDGSRRAPLPLRFERHEGQVAGASDDRRRAIRTMSLDASATRGGTVTIAGRSLDAAQEGVATFDLNADGRSDVLWRHDETGALGVWLVDGHRFLGAVSLTPDRVADLTWEIVATGDLNGDGDGDIVWRNAQNGVLVGWLMHGATMVSGNAIGRVDDLAWRVRASGDFNGDGFADLVWQHQGDGRIALWFMDGLQNTASELLPQVVADTNWHIVGTGDFDLDGRRDLLWRHQVGGEIGIWRMAGRSVIAADLLPYDVDPRWEIRAIGDVDGNGSPDWLWQLFGRRRVIAWLMDGLTLRSGAEIGTFGAVDEHWQVVGPK
jgi:VCBS repeat protein